MYAVIRAGGKQYRVAPGDVVQVEKVETEDGVQEVACEVLAVSSGDGVISKAGEDAHVVGEVVEQGRAKKIIIFHYKRKKQYKRLRGHRQPFTALRITEIGFGGNTVKAPAVPAKKAKADEAEGTPQDQKTKRHQAVKAAPTGHAAKKKAKRTATRAAAREAKA